MTIDLTRLPAPTIIEPLDYTTLRGAFITQFLTVWNAARAVDPTLPVYDVDGLETDPFVIVAEAWTYLRLLDRSRVNDAVRALLAPLAQGTDLDNVAANLGVQRLVIVPATATTAAVMESDARLLDRYLAALDRPCAGSAKLYRFTALTAWPLCLDVAVIGQSVHGRRGDVDVVITGPNGRVPTQAEILSVTTALAQPGVKPEATSVTVVAATPVSWNADLVLSIPNGPDPSLVQAEATTRVQALATARMTIGGEVPADAVDGAAYGPSVIKVTRNTPTADLLPQPYAIPVLGTLTLTTQVRT